VPGSKFFRAPSTIFYVTTFATAMLAAFGAERLLAGELGRRAFAWSAGFALAIAADAADAQRKWTTLQASAGAVALVGVDGVQIEASDLSVLINRPAKDGVLIDYAAQPLEVKTGPSSTMTLDVSGQDGPLVQALGTLELNVADFFSVSGDFAVRQSWGEVTLSDGSQLDAELLTIGGANINAFAGLRGGTVDAIGLSLGQADFGLALVSDRLAPARQWTTLQATAELAAFLGDDAITVSGTDLSVAINLGLQTSDSGAPAVSLNTTYQLVIGPDTLGSVTFKYQGNDRAITVLATDQDAELIAKVRGAVEGFTGIGAGNVQVSGDRTSGFTIEFIGTLAGQDIAELTVTTAESISGSVTVTSVAAYLPPR